MTPTVFARPRARASATPAIARRLRLGALGAAVTCAALAAAPAASARDFLEQVERLESPLAAGSRLLIDETSSSLDVTLSGDGLVHVIAHKFVEGGGERARMKTLDEIAVRLEEEPGGGALRVRSEIPESARHRFIGISLFPVRWSLGLEPKAWIDYEIQLPRGAVLDASITSGEVRVTGTASPITVRATSGDIDVERAAGDVVLTATSGRATVRDVTGSVRIEVTSGDVSCEGVTGYVDLDFVSSNVALGRVGGAISVSGTSGDVGLEDCPGPIDLEIASGNVTVAGGERGLDVTSSSGSVIANVSRAGGSGIKIATSSGSVDLSLGEASSSDVDLATSSGIIRIKGPIAIDTASRSRFRGKLGAGGERVIAVETQSGDITVVAAVPPSGD